jgi:hypothetical protein
MPQLVRLEEDVCDELCEAVELCDRTLSPVLPPSPEVAVRTLSTVAAALTPKRSRPALIRSRSSSLDEKLQPAELKRRTANSIIAARVSCISLLLAYSSSCATSSAY